MGPLLSFVLPLTLLVPQDADEGPWTAETFRGLQLRSLGPALMSGRIADLAIHPEDDNVWYVAVGSGGVWKTENAGVTFTPIFDDQPSYSIGCVTIDPQQPDVVWVGTGENVGGRHVGFGDGIYRSTDGGATWENRGLRDSEHLSKIVIDPNDSNRIWVAAQGPLWRSGGERGVYRTTDGGESWTRVLGDDEWMGATDLVQDPRDPNRLFAATWHRHRTVAAYLGGGPGTGLWRSDDGGGTWTRLTRGLPESNMGKIGLAMSAQDPDVLYAAIELDRRTGGVFRSADGGRSWEKRSETVSGGTGPHYYQELAACPHHFDRLYLMDVRIQISDDGGTTFRRLSEAHKHSDNHAIAFRADDPNYLLVGTDGGLYESFDDAQHWRFFANLPLTQFYKLALDDAEPFYHVIGGTQDNCTQHGPVRTDNVHGIQNSDWRIVLDWDGHQPATEPGNPAIVYAERQEGHLARVDVTTGEVIDIQPQPEAGADPERFNWDAPILVSPHQPTRIYFASQRVWHSDDRGDAWTAISGDLTRNEERFALPIGGGTQSWDNAWDVAAMSNYNTITSLAESPVTEGLLYAGTDDGLLHVRDPSSGAWRRIELGAIDGVAERAFVNDVKADRFDANVVYLALDDHKSGDLRPYLLRSSDRGRSWTDMTGDLPERTLVWRVVQDYERRDLFFLATEFGLYFSADAGEHWVALEGGVPTISFRDLAIHPREGDLVGASFGRGFYVLDDVGPLREVTAEHLAEEATLFSTRPAWWYVERPLLDFDHQKGALGASHYVAPNPPFGAVFTYHLRDGLRDRAERREEAERARSERGETVGFPGWETLEAEARDAGPRLWLTVRDSTGQVVRRIEGPTSEGMHRVAWDLRHPSPEVLLMDDPPPPMFGAPPRGLLAAPGTYEVSLSKEVDGLVTALSIPRTFEVRPLRSGALPAADPAVVAAFWRRYENAVREHSAQRNSLRLSLQRVERLQMAIARSRAPVGDLDTRRHALREQLQVLVARVEGDRARTEPGEKTHPTIGQRLESVARGISLSTHGPTATHRQSLEIAEREMQELAVPLRAAEERLAALVQAVVDAGGPWLEGSSRDVETP